MSVQQELDRKVSKLDRLLQRILYMYLLGQLTSLMAKTQADAAFNEAYTDFMNWFRKEHPEKFNSEANRIMKTLHEIKEDFDAVIEARTEEKEKERELKRRTWLIALGFVFGLHRATMITYAIEIKAWLRYNTQEDPRVCLICESLKGVYKPEDYPLIPHPECRCFATVELIVV